MSTDETTLEKARVLPKPLKIILIVVVVLVAIALFLINGINVYVHAMYSDYYKIAQDEFPIPGLDTPFVVQDIDYVNNTDDWLFSGYMSDGTPSPVYRQEGSTGNAIRFFVEEPDGTMYAGHGSAITSTDDHVFLTCEMGYLVMNSSDVETVESEGTVKAIDKIDLDFSPAFMNIELGDLFAGTFYMANEFETDEKFHIPTADGYDNRAIMYAYPGEPDAPYGFATHPDHVYSIPQMVQGICSTRDGKLIFSCSYALATSKLLSYNALLLEQEGTFEVDGVDVPLYVLDSRSFIGQVDAPPMSEGIESHEGRLYISTESACSKYFFGRIYGATDVESISLENL